MALTVNKHYILLLFHAISSDMLNLENLM